MRKMMLLAIALMATLSGNAQIEEGDKVVLRGKVTKYGSTYETSSKKAYVYSVEKSK